jgi:hypothetical protein
MAIQSYIEKESLIPINFIIPEIAGTNVLVT